jgi:hypothetical protein
MLTSQRHLPHWYAIGQPLFVTFRLHGSLPCGREFPPQSTSSGEAFLCLDRLLDGARIGPTYLAMPSIAGIVADSMRHCSEIDYRLHAWVIMPNHVHLLATPRTDVSDRTGQAFWQEESYDRLVRTPGEFTKIEAYILTNPVKAGLARSAAEYRWSSAYQGE